MLANRIEQGFDAYSEWRGQLYDAVELFRNWLQGENFSDEQSVELLADVLSTITDDKLYVAFVAEFSRGKSELINATFFAQLGKRVLPSNAGRTTMCPTELVYNAAEEPSIKLLPIDTRTSDTPVVEYRSRPEAWQTKIMDPFSADSVRDALTAVTDVIRVPEDEARKLGLLMAADAASDGVRPDADGLVEVPRWRHAIINFPHPLLEQGLVILDTPGLNALGAEPGLTLNMLSAAHAIVFILAADAGVTKSDMAVWQDHIMHRDSDSTSGRLVVLNKVDVLWDDLRDDAEVAHEINRQLTETGKILGVEDDAIFPVSAQKALLGKVRKNEGLLEQSGIKSFEDALANVLIPAKIEIVRDHIATDIQDVIEFAQNTVKQRLAGAEQESAELNDLNSQNLEVIEDMMVKVREDKEQLERNLQRYQATRSIFSQQTTKLYRHISVSGIDRMMAEAKRDMELSPFTGQMRARMVQFFKDVNGLMEKGSSQAGEIHELMEGVYQKFKDDHGLAHIKPRKFSVGKYLRELQRLEQKNEHLVKGMSTIMQTPYAVTARFFESVVVNVKQIFKKANRDADIWLKTILAPMENQVRDHQAQLKRRLESIKRIYRASDGVDDRTDEINDLLTQAQRQQAEVIEHIKRVERLLDIERTGQMINALMEEEDPFLEKEMAAENEANRQASVAASDPEQAHDELSDDGVTDAAAGDAVSETQS